MHVGCLNLQPSTSLYRNVTLADASSTIADMCMGVASAEGTSSTKLWKCVLMRAAQLLWFSSFCQRHESHNTNGQQEHLTCTTA